ncbi:MAG: hypothetical protein KTR30_18735 [Saprospiraceae bacterium]|nr:hypothetical protein [Saprospiraceae bacterium]
MKKFYCLLLALSLVSFLPLNAQDAPHSGEDTPLSKEESQETPAAAVEEDLAEYAALEEVVEEESSEEKAKANGTETEKKTACINISPSEQKASNKEQGKKAKPNATGKEKINKSPKCSKLKSKEAEATKKKPKASSRVKLVSYRPGNY